MTEQIIELGDDHNIEFTTYKDDRYAGAIVTHKTTAGAPCESWIAIRGHSWSAEFEGGLPHASWELEAIEPVTLSPSLACRACGDHGFIRGGKWVKA